MKTVVTTSSNTQQYKTKGLFCALFIVCIMLACLFLRSCERRRTAALRPDDVESVITTNKFKEVAECRNNERKVTLSSRVNPIFSPNIIRAGNKGEEHVIQLSHTGMVIRAVTSRMGISSTNQITYKEAVFKTPTENFLHRYASSAKSPIMIMSRFNSDLEDEVRKVLETDIVVYDTDDNETVAIKESVAALKQDILKAISEGYNATDIFNAMREDNNRRVRSRVRMQRELNGLIQSNMVDEAVEYFNKANAELSDNFLPPLIFDEAKLPKTPDF